jgi:hypothetical protein
MPEKKKEKRENTPNGTIIKRHMFGVPILRYQHYKWQNCEAHYLESYNCNFLENGAQRLEMFCGFREEGGERRRRLGKEIAREANSSIYLD